MLTCKISGRLRRSESERSARLWANRFIVNQRQLRLSQQQRNSYHLSLLRGQQEDTRAGVRRLFPIKKVRSCAEKVVALPDVSRQRLWADRSILNPMKKK